MASWTFTLADLNGLTYGDFRAMDRSISLGVSRTATASCRIDSSDQLWQLSPLTWVGKTTLKVTDSVGNLRFWGPLVSAEETGQGQGATVTLTAADMTWRLGKRYYAKDPTGVGLSFTAQSPSAIAYGILSALNTEGATGITQGTAGTFGVTFSQTFLYKRALDAIAELGSYAGSYEWGLSYSVVAGVPTAKLDLPVTFGTDKSTSVFFEYGTGKLNSKAFNLVTSIDTSATDVYALGAAGSVSAASDATARSAYGRYDDVISFSDISDGTMLSALSSAHVAIRANPRQVVNITPFTPTAPQYGVDWVIGDTVWVEAAVDNGGNHRFSGAARIWGADITIDNNGQEEATLSLAA